jgi:DNA-binding NarL/FixJ family response regulator
MENGSALDVLEGISDLKSKIIFLTALIGESDMERAKKIGCKHYLKKNEATFSDIIQAVVAEVRK